MEVSINTIVEVLNGVEGNLKKALYEVASYGSQPIRQERIDNALKDIQSAISRLLQSK